MNRRNLGVQVFLLATGFLFIYFQIVLSLQSTASLYEPILGDDCGNTFQIFVPVIIKDYFEGPNEQEDNDSYSSANGLLYLGREYYGETDDQYDIYKIYITTGKTIIADMTNHVPNGQLNLLDHDFNHLATGGSDEFKIRHEVQASGLYYLIVNKPEDDNAIVDYGLVVYYEEIKNQVTTKYQLLPTCTPTPTITLTPTITITPTPQWEEIGQHSATEGGISDEPDGTDEPNDSQNPSLVAISDEAVYVTWADIRTNGKGEVFVKKWDGSNWEFLGESVSNNTNTDSLNPAIAVQNGQPYVVWENEPAQAETKEIYVRWWNGSDWREIDNSGGGGGISNTFSQNSLNPSVAVFSDQAIYVAWQEYYTGTVRNEIYVLKGDSISSDWTEIDDSASGEGISDSNGDATNPIVSLFPNNTLVVVWQSQYSVSNTEIYLKQWDGSRWISIEGSANGGGISDTSDNSELPTVTIGTDNTVYVAWQEKVDDNYEIYIRKWDGEGDWVEVGEGSAQDGGISNNCGDSKSPSLFFAGGMLYIAWSDNSEESDSGCTPTDDYEIYVKRFNGTFWEDVGYSSIEGGSVSNNDYGSLYPTLFVDQGGIPYVAWQNRCEGETCGDDQEIFVRYYPGD